MSQKITVVRMYLLEGKDNLDEVLRIIHDQEHVSGVTVIRAIEGYGESEKGAMHTSSLLTLSLELPLVVEFFDEPERVEHVIYTIKEKLGLKHIISWSAVSHIHDD